jgi:hypothetical protein
MARHLRREEPYLLKGVSALEQILEEPERSARLDAIIRRLRAVKSGLLD